MDEASKLRALNEFVRRAQRVLAVYLPEESGKSEKEVIGDLLTILGSRELIRLQKEIGTKPFLISS